MRFWIAVFLCFTVNTLVANPVILEHPVFISSERLDVIVGDTAASFSGRFHFASPIGIPEYQKDGDVYLDIPIWIPAKAVDGDQSVKDFYSTFNPPSNWMFTKLRPESRAAFERAFGFRMTIDGVAHPINGFSLFNLSDRDQRNATEKAWLQKGFTHIVVFVTFRPEILKRDPEFRITYRQPLLLKKTQAELFYIPNFDHLPKGRSTSDLDRYSLTLRNASYGSLSVGNQNIPLGSLLRLPVSHHAPIHVVCHVGSGTR